MVGGVQGFVNKKHQQYGGNENEAPVTQAELAQRQAAVRELGLKAPGLGAGRRSHSASSSGVPFRDAATAPARAGSPLAMQHAGAQNGFATQGRNQINGQGQGYAQIESMWAESTLGSDSLGTVRDRPLGYLNSDDNELEDTQGQHHDQDAGLSDQISDSDPEEEEVGQNIAGYHQNHNANPRQPGTNQTSIPVRGVHTGRFVGEPQGQQHQPPITETVLSNGKGAGNGSGQSYNQKMTSGRLGRQVQKDEDHHKGRDAFAPSEVDEDTMHSIAGNGGKHPRKGSKRQADDISDVDFDLETLFKMPYKDLRNQPFDEDLNQDKHPSLIGLPPSLDERMELFKAERPEDQAAFLASLSIDEWEEAGEWLMKQFGTVMTKVADARRDRRKIATEFENRLAARDAEVRQRTDDVTAALKDIKKAGEDLLRGKTPT